jgi:hypothetical protein
MHRSLYSVIDAQVLPPVALRALASAYPTSLPRICANLTDEALGVELVSGKLDVECAANLAAHAGPETLLKLLGKDRRESVLRAAVERCRHIPAGVQRRIVRAKLSEQLAQMVARLGGLDPEAALVLLEKNPSADVHCRAVWVAAQTGEWDRLVVPLSSFCSRSSRSVTLAGLFVEHRELREAVYRSGRWDLLVEVAPWVPRDELHHLVAVVEAEPRQYEMCRVAATLAEDPATPIEVRHLLWSHPHRAAFMYRHGVADPDLLPCVDSYDELDEATVTAMLCRAPLTEWYTSRLSQMLRLIGAVSTEGHQERLGGRLNGMFGYNELIEAGLGGAWLNSHVAGFASGKATSDAHTCAQRLVAWQEACQLTDLSVSTHAGRVVLRSFEPYPEVPLAESPWSPRVPRGAAVLVERFGDNVSAWQMAFALYPKFAGTFGELADTAAVAVGLAVASTDGTCPSHDG